MIDLIGININKRLNLLSFIFILITIFLVIGLIIYYAEFDLTTFQVLNEYEFVFSNYVLESLQIIEIVVTLFIIFLVMMELFYNINNFDAYFISLTNKKDYFIAKTISYLLVIFAYISVIFLGFVFVYVKRFNSIKELIFMFKIYMYYGVYFLFIFLIAYLFLLLFSNYFSVIIVFIIYWISKVISNENFNKFAFLNIKINAERREISLSFNSMYLIFYLLILILLNFKIYIKKDIKINS